MSNITDFKVPPARQVIAGTHLSGGGNLSGNVTLNVVAASTNTANTLVVRDGSGNFSAGNITGNITTATRLQTTRSINGTNFDGTVNITTLRWGTARTITVGNTGKSIDGSATVTWSISEIGALAVGNNLNDLNNVQTARTNLGFNNATTTSGSKTLVNWEFCTVTASGRTITLPNNPPNGATVGIGVLDFTNTIIARNGQNIMGLGADMTIDRPNVTVTLKFYSGIGWRIV